MSPRDYWLESARLLIPPPGVITSLNGQVLAARSPIRVLEVKELATVVDVGGEFRRSARNTTISLYEPLPGEVASIYEMGIPVVEERRPLARRRRPEGPPELGSGQRLPGVPAPDPHRGPQRDP